MVGGRSYGKNEGQSEFNRTTQSRRSPGSSFKYFIYTAAMASGKLTPWTVRVDEPIVIGDWAPGNYEDKFYGPVTLAQAYAKSLNMVAIEVAHEIGGDAVIEMAEKLGVRTKLYNYRSLALGAQGLSLMEMTTGYGAMANDGSRIDPHGIARVRRASGQVLWAYRGRKTDPVIDVHTQRLMNFLGTRVVQGGTGTRAQIAGREIAGKTGTSNDYRDAWFLGYVPGLVAGVWVGNDNFAQMKKVTGGTLAAPIWREFMLTALRDTPVKPLNMPRDEDMPQPVVVDAAGALDGLTPAAQTSGPLTATPNTPSPESPPPSAKGGEG
jgi:penicillin-binding protein 1A